jgi:hypothetical protein
VAFLLKWYNCFPDEVFMAETNKERREALIAKIKALLAKTIKNGATEHEALTAASKAAELMEKYDIEIGDDDEVEDEVINNDFTFPPEFNNHITTVSSASAKLCEVEVIGLVDGSHLRTGYRIYGLPVDVEIAQYLHEIIIGAMKHELKRARGAWMLYVPRKRDIAQHSFLDGLTERLAERIRELAWARQHKKTGNALVLSKDALIKAAMEDVETFNKKKRRRDIDGDALKSGFEAANRINLNPALGSDGELRGGNLNGDSRFASIDGRIIPLKAVEELAHQIWSDAQSVAVVIKGAVQKIILLSEADGATRDQFFEFVESNNKDAHLIPHEVLIARIPVRKNGEIDFKAALELAKEMMNAKG